MAGPKMIEIRNITRTEWWFRISDEVAKRARKDGSPNIAEDSPHLVIGDSKRKWSGDPEPDPVIPEYVWESAAKWNGSESLEHVEDGKMSRFGKPQNRQGKTIKALLDSGDLRARSAA